MEKSSIRNSWIWRKDCWTRARHVKAVRNQTDIMTQLPLVVSNRADSTQISAIENVQSARNHSAGRREAKTSFVW